MLCDARDHASPFIARHSDGVKRYKGTCAVEHIILALRSLRSRCAAGSGWLHTSRLAHERQLVLQHVRRLPEDLADPLPEPTVHRAQLHASTSLSSLE